MVRRGRYESGAWAKVHWSQWKFPLKSIDWQSESSAHLGKDHSNAQKEMLRFSSMLESPAETIQCINKELTIKTLTQSSCPNLWNSLAGISGFVSLKHLDSPSKDPAMSHPSWVPMVSDRCITHLFPASQCEKEQEKKKELLHFSIKMGSAQHGHGALRCLQGHERSCLGTSQQPEASLKPSACCLHHQDTFPCLE